MLPDLSNWNTNNIINMTFLFRKCSSLKCLPDISNWNTYNIKYIKGMFFECSNLEILPDILCSNIIVNKQLIIKN